MDCQVISNVLNDWAFPDDTDGIVDGWSLLYNDTLHFLWPERYEVRLVVYNFIQWPVAVPRACLSSQSQLALQEQLRHPCYFPFDCNTMIMCRRHASSDHARSLSAMLGI